jgi:hypothetical protein
MTNHHHHHHRISVMELGHLLTRFGLTSDTQTPKYHGTEFPSTGSCHNKSMFTSLSIYMFHSILYWQVVLYNFVYFTFLDR